MSGGSENVNEMTCDPNVCQPIGSYEDVLKFKHYIPAWHNEINKWTYNTTAFCLQGSEFHCHNFSTELHTRHKLRSDVPKTLFCHDLKGGYLEDRFVNGSSVHDEYRYFHWAVIDTFVYFSHHFITIPPPMWIDAGHLHGTKVLGTLITEWNVGEKVWQNILKNEKSVEEFVDCLVSICCNFGFDGYLLNVENIIDAAKISLLELFVSMLHSKLHKSLPHCEVIWYDSVTKYGRLEWQNELNELNRIFFNNCDGIFLNYTWTEEHLKISAENAGSRLLDVYVGVDVFGRNCYSGGGFNTYEALKVVRKQNLSVALFAPSWVHEYLGRACFTHLEYAFWQKLWPYLYVHGPTQLPFSTSFCQGYGKKLYHNGNVVSTTPWYNLSKQQYQPTVPSCLDDSFVEPIVTVRALQDVKPENDSDKHSVSTEEKPENVSDKQSVSTEEKTEEKPKKDSDKQSVSTEEKMEEKPEKDSDKQSVTTEEKTEEKPEKDSDKQSVSTEEKMEEKPEKDSDKQSVSTEEKTEEKPEKDSDKQSVSTEETEKISQEKERKIKAPSEEMINKDVKDSKSEEQTHMNIDHSGCVQHYDKDAFNGGGCLKIQNSSSSSHQKLILCDFHCTGATKVTVATKPLDEEDTALNILLLLRDPVDDDDTRYIVLAGKERAENREIPAEEFYPVKENIGEISAYSGWVKKTYKFTAVGNILEICVEVVDGKSILLGWLEIMQDGEVSNAGNFPTYT